MKTFIINGELRTEEDIDTKELIIKLMQGLKSNGIHYEGTIDPRNNTY
ncbi:hypothetical protein [Siminovitchia fordii]|uniref:Uncharacterized protein n=1 Tax=Siminovitchia fordii TaxID=254759 RepID=A0ABQ4KBT2_9BACI|nr:hypothetical protein [Siminovitchia fordii]GIN22593.1 hypothetical protein J1TS3_37270 [Siminovitchia fordii]